MASIAAFDVWQRGNGTKVGTVLQAVEGSYNTSNSYANASWNYIQLGATITPFSTTSRILVLFNTGIYHLTSASVGFTTIYRNGVNLGTGANAAIGAQTYNASGVWIPMSGIYVDSPATTSATEYKIYGRTSQASGAVWGSDGGVRTSILLLELQA